MNKTRRRYSREFKIAIVTELEAGKPLAQLVRENAIHPSLPSRWRKEFATDPERAFQGNGRGYKQQARIAELERLVGQLYAESALLKKALAILEKRAQDERSAVGRRTDTC